MVLRDAVLERSNQKCELCSSKNEVDVFTVSPKQGIDLSEVVAVCIDCKSQLTDLNELQPNHWRCLGESMWSEISAVQVVAWRMLNRLKSEGWPVDLLNILDLDEDTKSWAELSDSDNEVQVKHIDANGVQLLSGDAVVLIKDLKVKGAGFTAKRGTPVRNITLVQDNQDQIEGKVNGQKIVILTQYVKK